MADSTEWDSEAGQGAAALDNTLGEGGNAQGELRSVIRPGQGTRTPAAWPLRYPSCSSSPALLSTVFSPASIDTAKRFCFGGIGQLNA
jgi:hypothetical protein